MTKKKKINRQFLSIRSSLLLVIVLNLQIELLLRNTATLLYYYYNTLCTLSKVKKKKHITLDGLAPENCYDSII